MISTRHYYPVVRDLIHEVIDIFDTPEMFNFGFDDENRWSQVRYDYACYRQHELYWHDYRFILDTIREKGVRPWVFVDPYIIDNERFIEETAKDVVVSPNYYQGSIYEDDSTKRPRIWEDLKHWRKNFKFDINGREEEISYSLTDNDSTLVLNIGSSTFKINLTESVSYQIDNILNKVYNY